MHRTHHIARLVVCSLALLLLGLIYAAGSGASHIWQIETVASGLGAYGGYATLALDAAGEPHIAYYDSTDGALKYAVGASPIPPTPTPMPCYWDSFTFGVDSWIDSAPGEYTVATFPYGGATRPALVAVPYGAGRSVFGPGSLFSQLWNVPSPGNVRHSIFLNSVAWVTSGKPPAQTHVLVTWGHRELVTFHLKGQCCSSNVVQALTAAGYNVDTAFDVPASLDGYDVVVMPGVGWFADPGYSNPQWWSGSSGHALTPDETAALLSFVQGGGGLVASVEWNLGAAWMSPVANPMAVTLVALSGATPLEAIRVLGHPVMERPCATPTPPPTVEPTATPPPLPTSTPAPPAVVSIDIKPGSCPNPVQRRDHGTLAVAVLGTAIWDVTRIDPATVRLQGVAPLRYAYEDVSRPPVAPPDVCNCTTDGPDGYADLVLHFDVQAILATLPDEATVDVARLSPTPGVPPSPGPLHRVVLTSVIHTPPGKQHVLTLTATSWEGAALIGQDCIIVLDNLIETLVGR